MILAALVLLLSLSTGSSAEPLKYFPLELHELIGQAELCFAGTIVALDESTIQVEVEQWGFGEPRSEHVTVERFRDWTCAKRWTPYALGQRCLYFVARRTGESWHILSGGGEGEMPLVDDRVKIRAAFPVAASEGGGRMALATFLEECRRYRAAFRRVPRERWSWVEARQTTDEVKAYAHSSPLAEFLALETFDGWYRDPNASSPRAAEARLDLGIGPLPSALVCLTDGEGPAQLVCTMPGTLVWLELDAAGKVRARRDLSDEGWGWGASLASLGDLGGDGTRELAVGEPESQTAVETANAAAAPQGVVRVLSFDAEGALQREHLVTLSDPGFGGPAFKPERFGHGLAALGDLDGDGTFELAVSTDYPVGWIWIASLGSEGEVVRARVLLDGREAVRGPLALAVLGDLDENGVVDLAAAGPARRLDADTGVVQVFLLARDGSPLARHILLTDERRGAGFGGTLAAPGDWNGDGTPDLVVGGLNDPLRVLCLAADGGLAAELVLPRPADLDPHARFGAALAVRPTGAGPRVLAAGHSWIETSTGADRRVRACGYPSVWSFGR